MLSNSQRLPLLLQVGSSVTCTNLTATASATVAGEQRLGMPPGLRTSEAARHPGQMPGWTHSVFACSIRTSTPRSPTQLLCQGVASKANTNLTAGQGSGLALGQVLTHPNPYP